MLDKHNDGKIPESVWSDYAFDRVPFDEIVHFGQRSLLKRDLFVVSWLLGRFCNYSCSYCWPYASTKKKDHRPWEVLERTMHEIKRQARERNFRSFHFSFSGGEPTFHPNYLELLKMLADDTAHCNYQSVHMTSNCSQPLKWFESYVKTTENLHRVSVTASFHKEFAKRDQLKEKLVFLQSNDVQVTVNMVMVPARFEELWNDALYFHEAGLNVTLKPQSNTSATAVVDGYTEEQLRLLQLGLPQMDYVGKRLRDIGKEKTRPRPTWDPETDRRVNTGMARHQVELTDGGGRTWYLDQAERFNSYEFNRFQGWDCSAGYRSLIIREPDGVVKRGYSCSDTPLGTLEGGFRLFPDVKTCTTKSCVSSADSKIPKRRPSCDQPLWGANKSPGLA